MSKKVLFPTDGSDAAMCAAQQAAVQLSEMPDVEVTVFVAVAYYDESETDGGEDLVRQRNFHMRRRADSVVAQTATVFEKQGIKTSVKVVEGDPVSLIIAEEAAKGGYNLIVMGSRGVSLSKEKLSYVGSVTQHVLRRVTIPVLVIPVHEVYDED